MQTDKRDRSTDIQKQRNRTKRQTKNKQGMNIVSV